MVFNWSLSDSKSVQVSRTLLNILADFNDTVGWMISAHLPISSSSNSLTKSIGIVLSALITIGITVTFMCHSFFSYLASYKYLCLFVFFLLSLCVSPGRQSPRFGRCFSFRVWLSQSLVFWLECGDLFVSQNLSEFCASHSPSRILFCAYNIY